MSQELTALEVGAKMNARQAEAQADFDFNAKRAYQSKVYASLRTLQGYLANPGTRTDKMIADMNVRLVKIQNEIASFDVK